ncbi:MAG: helix-turn-helix domain-containing protein [Bdellovibrionales bacterium]|nr:helix-turn-helix domain-containing protein [Bdellovibrionales bacterium]
MNSVKDINKSWLSTDEAAKYLGKTRNAIWQLVSKGLLIKRKWRRRLYFKKLELDQLIENSLI